MARQRKRRKSKSLIVVHRFFPKVKTVKDATSSILVEVTKRDQTVSKRSRHNECAMAVACRRATKADGIIISRSTAYVVKRNTATRYLVPERVSREIVSFDRGADFAAGTYTLSKPDPSCLIGMVKRSPDDRHTGSGAKHVSHHATTGIRTSLVSKNAAE